MANEIKITVEGADQGTRTLLAAFFNVSFRKMGAYPAMATTDERAIIQLGADDMTLGSLVVQLLTAEGAPRVTVSDGSVEAKAAAASKIEIRVHGLDAEGNLVDDTGVLIKTKQQLASDGGKAL